MELMAELGIMEGGLVRMHVRARTFMDRILLFGIMCFYTEDCDLSSGLQ